MSDPVVGIDLGTTNSEIAAFVAGQVRVIGPGSKMLPSCVGFSPDGDLLVGESARNQQLLYPDRTVRSIKRKMGSAETVPLAGKNYTPPEISALILRELSEWARRSMDVEISKAVITVPAYFSDAQRSATIEAGTLAGLDVIRILNEPTAASLAYGFGAGKRHTALVYDLGGGTFDVSIVVVEDDITEVLASHGNNLLGGDDFDDLLLERLMREFESRHKINLREGHAAARARLRWAAEEAKKKLSFEPYAKVREEALVVENGRPLHLELEIARGEYEDMIRPLVDSTLDSVSKALADAAKRPGDLDAILLVGGSTRTPLVSRLLQERTGLEPRQDVHPDLCVALGAGVLASRLAGHAVERVLVDVSPYSFGPSYLGERGGFPYPYCYHPIIKRNTPLPLTRSESYYTAHPNQKEVTVQIYQGEDEDALKNILVGDFGIAGLTPMDGPNEVVCRMSLDLDGILRVSAIEKRTGKSQQVTIANAMQAKSSGEIEAARKRVEELYASRRGSSDEDPIGFEFEEPLPDVFRQDAPPYALIGGEAGGNGSTDGGNTLPVDSAWPEARREAHELIERSRRLLDKMHNDDREEAIDLHERVAAANDAKALTDAMKALKEFLFFVEGR